MQLLNDNQLKALSLPVSSRDELKKAITAKQQELGEKRYSVRELTKSKLDLLRAAQELEIDLSSYTSIDGARSSKGAEVTATQAETDPDVSQDDVAKAWFEVEQAQESVNKAHETLEKVKAIEGDGNEAIVSAAQAVLDKAVTNRDDLSQKAKALADAHKAQQQAKRRSVAVTAPSLADIEWQEASKVFGNKSKALKGVQVPVFVGKHDSQTAEHVPTADPNFFFGYEDGELLADILISFGAVYKSQPSNSNTWLWGQRGAGKSELVTQIAARTNRPLFVTSCHRELTIEQLGGEFDPRSVAQGGSAPVLLEPSFAKGVATAHAIVVLDEVGRVNPTNAVGFNGTLETRVLSRIDGSQVTFAEGVTIAVTDNTDGSGDPTGQFEAYAQDQSFLDRFRAVIKVPFLPQAQESKVLIAKEGICKPVADLIVKIMASFRGATDGSGGHQARSLYPSLRGAFAMAYALREGKAFRRAIVHHLIGSACPSDQQIAQVLIDQIAPSDDEVREVLNGTKADFAN
jgi:hypothetical protein